MGFAPSKPGSTIQSFFRVEALDKALVHDARLVIAGCSTDVEDARNLMDALGVAPRQIGILTR